jgi:predicted glycoside hydrolase/deacetylase ChbG (UPF0249 family)
MTEGSRLVINADDLGLTEGVNRGIIEAHRAGVVTSASLLATGSAFGDAIARLRDAPALGVGVHLDFVAGRPLTAAASLVNTESGRFHSLPALARRALLGRIDERDVAVETEAQIDRVRAAGIEPTHVDGHRHAHLLPGVWPAVVRAAAGAGVRVVRCPTSQLTRGTGRGGIGGMMKTFALRAAASRASRRDPAALYVDHFAGPALQGRPDFESALLRLIDELPPGTTELMVHPGYADQVLASLDPYVVPRQWELRALLSPAVRDRLRARAVSLVSFAGLVHR